MLYDPRLARLARIMNVGVWVGLMSLPLSFFWVVFTDGLAAAALSDAFSEIHISPDMPLATGVAVLAVGSFALIAAMAALWHMHRLLMCYQSGEAISPRTARIILRIGQSLLVAALMSILSVPIQTVLLTLHNPTGQRSVAIGIDTQDMGFVLAGGLLVLIGWVMREAVGLAEDNAAIV